MTMKDKKKSKVKRIVIICIVVAIAILLFQPARAFLAMTTMRTLPSQEVVADIFSIKNSYVNLYLFKSGDKYIAFDAGSNADSTKAALADFGIDEGDIIAIFLTHTDYDHVAAVPLFPSADIFMAQSNKVFLENDPKRSQGFINIEREYKTLSDMEKFTINDTQIQCIFTPGHTDGSASYIINGKYLVTGDNLRLKKDRATLFYTAFNMNKEEQKQSIHKLSRLEGIDAVFTMHTGYTTDFDTAFAKWTE